VISVIQLGKVPYADGLRLQQMLVDLRKAGAIGDVLLLLEHPPVITLGRNAKEANVLASTELLAARGVEVFECDRGGDVTFHGPGQLVGYPIFDLRGYEGSQASGLNSQENSSQLSAISSQPSSSNGESITTNAASIGKSASLPTNRKTLGAVDYVRRLEEVLIRTCGDFGIPTKRVPGLTGVWTESSPNENDRSSIEHNREGHDRGPHRARFSRDGVDDLGRAETGENKQAALAAEGQHEAKIAALGVHISRSVTSHGFALNVNTDLSYFDFIVPCGITSKPVTSMQKELGRELDLNSIAEAISRSFGLVFQSQMLWLETIDAMLGNSVGVPMKFPEKLRDLHGNEDTSYA
jgi:lipoyl(octanoyl) transferase